MDEAYHYCYNNDIKDVFVHFGGKYDFQFKLEEACFGKNFYPCEMIPRGSGLLCFTLREREPKLFKKNGDPFEVVFRDSSALLPFALRTIANSFDVPIKKGEIDYNFIKHAYHNIDYTRELFANRKKLSVIEIKYDGKVVHKYKPKMHWSKITYIIEHEDGEKINHKIYRKADLLSYLEDDCVSLWQCVDVFFSWELVRKSGRAYTTAGQAVKIWQTFLKEPIFSLNSYADDFIRAAYIGGRTEVFKPFFDNNYNIKKNPFSFDKIALKHLKKQKGKKLFYIDENSLYPTVMRDNIYPIGSDGFCGGEDYDPKGLGFWEATVDVPESFCPFLGIKHEFPDGTEKLIFPTGRFTGKWATQEIEYARSLGVKIISIEKGIKLKSGGHIFKDFIETLYAMRLDAKARGDGAVDLLCKLIMNACYGRLGLNIHRTNLVIDEGQEGVVPHSAICRDGEYIRFAEAPVTLDDSFTNVAISAYVTAYSKILMHKEVYMVAGPKHLYYTDTDCAFTTKPLRYFKIGKALGELKNEYEIKDKNGKKIKDGWVDSACFLLPKTYINDGIHDTKLNDKGMDKSITMKGFDRKKVRKFTMEDFGLALKGDMKRLRLYQGPKFATLKTALAKGKFLAMNFDPKLKKIYDKEKLELQCIQLEHLYNVFDPESKEAYLEITGLSKKIKNLSRKIEKDAYSDSYRQIKAIYDKRVIIDSGFNTKPIHLTKEIE